LPFALFSATHLSAHATRPAFAADIDVVQIRRRIDHGLPAVTSQIYAHLFKGSDTAAARRY
jgi:hypothetical protein